MKPTRGAVSSRVLFAVGSCLFLFFSSASFSSGHGGAEGEALTCPPEIKDLRLNYTTKYTPPTGWGHADAQSRRTKGGVHSNLTLVRNGHEVQNRYMVCLYGVGASESHLKLAAIRKLIPKGTSCTAEPDYSFKCVNMGK